MLLITAALTACSGPSSNGPDREPSTSAPSAPPNETPTSEAEEAEHATSASDEAPPEPPATADPLCPGLDARQPGQGPSVLLGRGLPEIDLAALAAAVPPHVGARARSEPRLSPAGIAGTVTPSATTQLAGGGETIDVRIADLSRTCLTRPGDGPLLRDRALASGPSRAIVVARWPAVVANAAAGTFVHAWVADRCQVTIGGAAEASLLEVADALDWSAIARLCAH